VRPRLPQLLLLLLLCPLAIGPAAQSPTPPRNPTKVTVSSSANPAAAGTSVIFTAVITAVGPASSSLPAGTVEFLDGAVSLGTIDVAGVDGRAAASLETPALAEGPHPISARYSGDSSHLNGQAEPVVQITTAQVP